MKNRISISTGLAVILTLGVLGGAAAEVVDRIVAVVNDEVISLSELELMAKSIQTPASRPGRGKDQGVQRQLLEALIDQKLANAEAKRRGITVSDKELEQALADFKRQNRLPDEAALNEALSKAHMTLNELKQKIRDQIVQERLMAVVLGGKLPAVSDAEVRRVYETEFSRERGAGVRLHLKILNLLYGPEATPARQDEIRRKAEAILKEHQQGASLEEISRRHSLPLQDLGYISEADLNPKLAAFLSKLKPKEVGPIQSAEGFQLVELVNRKTTSETRSFEEVAPQIRQMLMRQEMGKRFGEWVKGLRDKAHIKILL